MSWKTWVPLVLAIVLGLVAMKIARDVLSKNNVAPTPEDGTQIAVLNKDLPAGAQITPADLTSTKMVGEVNTQAVVTQASELQGRVLTAAAIKGTPLLQNMLAPKGAGSGLQSLIPDGMRAITIEVNEFSGVAGYLTPGCRVDIIATLTGDHGELISRAVVQNVKVQELGTRRAPETPEQPNAQVRSVTLIASPKEVEAIELAAAAGKPRLVLRSTLDNEPSSSDGVTITDLRGSAGKRSDPFAPVEHVVAVDQPKPAAPVVATPSVPKATPRQVQIIRAGVAQDVTIEEPVVAIRDQGMSNVDVTPITGGN